MARCQDGHSSFRVIIVGGSIAGLMLAHCLHRAGIDYLVLEARDDIAPQLGASVGIMPNGARILDQLGLFEPIEAAIQPLLESHVLYPDGFIFSSDFPGIISQRFGYPIAFLDRRLYLQILYDALPDKTRVHLGAKVVGIEETTNGVSARTSNQASYDGDIVVGADGVHSRVRNEMWRIADTVSPGFISAGEKQGR
ncbi:MAG: hypothetical protein Q9195_007211 [Heterodermia aff. obscurata]